MPSKVFKAEKDEVSQTPGDDSVKSQNGNGDLAELRRLIVQTEAVGEVLPEAVAQSSQAGDRLAAATLPIVEENIRSSAKRNPQILAEALFPVIGPAIRKAIAEALSQMVQSLNQTLEHSFSPKGVRWRVEAWQTGKPFAEIVILKTLLYRVEQIFLIHRETGLLLQHVAANPAASEDGDMVSAMLTAIQDFVRDSFKTSDNAMLDALQINELAVWIEHSPDLIFAAVIRGSAPLNVRESFKDAIERIQFDEEGALAGFKGDAAPFEKTRPVLRECLHCQSGEAERKSASIFKPVNVLAGILGLIILLGGLFYARDYWRWTNYLNRLQAENGIVVTEASRGWLAHSVVGLRDDLAANPDEILKESGYDAGDVETRWKPFQDLSPSFVLARAEKILQPPPNVKLSFENGALTADGGFDAEWFAEARKLAAAIAGVREFRAGFETLKAEIERRKINFRCGTTVYSDEQTGIAQVAAALENLFAARADKRIIVEIQGHASSDGSDEANSKISQERAEKVAAEIFSKSANLKSFAENFKAVGFGAEESAAGCSVTFKVTE
jgi:outer membrane protein OmpA-like peptidoglycan-associated protein